MAGQKSAPAFNAGIELIEEGVEDDADGWDFVDGKTKGDADGREGVDEVRGAVDGVDDEGGCGGELHAGFVGFFADELEGGVSGHEFCGDHFFDGLVGFCY